MGEKEGTAPSRTKSKKNSLNAQKKAQATADARVRSLFVTTMAAAPPAAGATPGTPHTTTTTTTTTMAAHSITTYAEHYAALPDDLQGRYNLLLAPYDPASGRSHQQLLHRLLSMSDASPKAFVGLVEHSGSYCTVLVHRIKEPPSRRVGLGWQGARVWWGRHARQPHRTARGRFRGGAGARRPHPGERESPSVGEPRRGGVGPIHSRGPQH